MEQPTNSMAWLEPVATHFLKEIQADLVHISACSVGLDMHKSWIFATCYRPLQALASVCTHPRGSHEDIRGTRDSSGGFRSRASAEYPHALAVKYAQQALPLFLEKPELAKALTLEAAPLLASVKGISDPPVSVQDGAGIFSVRLELSSCRRKGCLWHIASTAPGLPASPQASVPSAPPL